VRRFGAALTALALLWAPARAAERVVSLNLCSDQLLVLLAPERVAALSPLSRDPALSFVAREAASLPIVRPSAEAILRLHPDLVLGARWGAQPVLALLEAEHVPVQRLDLPNDFPGIAAATRALAAILGVPERADPLVQRMRATLAAVAHPGEPPEAIAWSPRGYTSGPGTLMDAVIRAAGYRNGATGGRLGLEMLLRQPPDLLIVPENPSYPSMATDLLDHPALRRIPRRSLPPALTICAGPFTAEAVSILSR